MRIFGTKSERRADDCRSDSAFILAIMYTNGFFCFIGCLFFAPNVPTESVDIIKQLVPVLSMIQGGIVQFFYQKSTQEREAKANQTIKELATTATTAAAAVVSNSVPLTASTIPPVPTDTNTGTMNVTSDSVIVNETEKK